MAKKQERVGAEDQTPRAQPMMQLAALGAQNDSAFSAAIREFRERLQLAQQRRVNGIVTLSVTVRIIGGQCARQVQVLDKFDYTV